MMLPVSVVIVTQNEEKNIREALQSIRDVAEIIIVDAFSTDNTLNISKEYTDKIYQAEWQGYAKQKQMAIERAKGQWVFILDADERFTESLWEEISRIVKNNKRYNGFYVPRKNFFLGKWIQHGGWWPDYTLRLFKKDVSYVEQREVHEKVIINGVAGYLKEPLEHYTYKTLSDCLKKMENYSTLSAKEILRMNPEPSYISFILKMLIRPIFTFQKMFFLKQGFRDGIYGFILAVLYSFYTFLKYAKVWEKRGG
jgi:glycosyltransferase involved in cell wall biosynthesis